MSSSGRRDQRGQASLLVVGFFLVIALTVGVVVDASAAYLQRQGLSNLADAAALAAADQVMAHRVYGGDVAERGAIDVAAAQRYAQMYLDQVGARSRYPGLRVSVSANDRTILVSLTSP